MTAASAMANSVVLQDVPTARTVWFPPQGAPPLSAGPAAVQDGHVSIGSRRATFFGVNWDQFAVFTPLSWYKGAFFMDPAGTAAVQKQLDNLVAAGVRAIRIHGLDCSSVESVFWPQGPATIANPTTRRLDPMALQALGFLFSECGKRDLRIVLTLHYLRQLTANDRPEWDCPAFDECVATKLPFSTGPGLMSPWFWFDEGLRKLQYEFNRQLLRWLNPYTGVALGDDPALLAVILQNEHSLVKDNPYAYPFPVLQSLWSRARSAFKSVNRIAGTDLNKAQWQECLASIEQAVFAEQVAAVRPLTKALVICGTYYGDAPYASIVGPAACGDIVDCHVYSRGPATDVNGLISGRTPADLCSKFQAVLRGCAWSSPAGSRLPQFVTEWGPVAQAVVPQVRDPDGERSQVMEAVVDAAVAQDVDAIFLYSWGHSALYDDQYHKLNVYDFRNDGVLLQGLQAQTARFHDLSLRPTGPPARVPLTKARVYGSGVGAQFQLPGPGSDDALYAVPAAQRVEMTRVD